MTHKQPQDKTAHQLLGLALEASSGFFVFRAVSLLLEGAPARLRSIPRILLYIELATSLAAAITGFPAWVLQPFFRPGLTSRRPDKPIWRLSSNTRLVIMPVVFVLHTLRFSIYLIGRSGIFGLKDWDLAKTK